VKNATPQQRRDIAVLRAAGCSLAQIQAKTGFSISTIQRICKRSQTRKGELQADLVDKAKREILDESFEDGELQNRLKLQIGDVLAHAELGMEKLAILLEKVEVSDSDSVFQALRANAAHSTALKNYSDTVRHLLPAYEVQIEPEEYVVTVITDEEVAAMTKEQEEADKDWLPND
jgi:IS30 family transposase